MDGILLINKEKGPTSFETIEKLKRKFDIKKVGHAGTLDPLAEGLLIVLINNATKINNYLNYEKEYEIEVKFGFATDTDDLEGKIIKNMPVPDDLKEKICKIMPDFTGEIEQIPPKYSSIKIDGKKLYELSRKGKVVEIKPRKIFIKSIDIIACYADAIKLRVICRTGAYMRSLARDLGEKSGSAATLSYLKRTRIGKFSVNESSKINEISGLEEKIISINDTLYEMPAVFLDKESYKKVRNGAPIGNNLKIYTGMCKLIYNNEVVAIGQIFGNTIEIRRGI
ncbi:MAG: tRNA pseudouridine(55) synthase TruB [Candidatus Goldbacteria bacterium]|nr:tRNA pseudouridine(55) synthase TruB [Candidatus Goldiibacteriota bacterium]